MQRRHTGSGSQVWGQEEEEEEVDTDGEEVRGKGRNNG